MSPDPTDPKVQQALEHAWMRCAQYEQLPTARAVFKTVQAFIFGGRDHDCAAAVVLLPEGPTVIVHGFTPPDPTFTERMNQLLSGGRPVEAPPDLRLSLFARRARQMLEQQGQPVPGAPGVREYRWRGEGAVRVLYPDGHAIDVPQN